LLFEHCGKIANDARFVRNRRSEKYKSKEIARQAVNTDKARKDEGGVLNVMHFVIPPLALLPVPMYAITSLHSILPHHQTSCPNTTL